MAELKIVAVVVVKPSFQEDLQKAFRIVVDETRKEAGNISYDLHQDIQNPLKYVILEAWKSQEAIDSHNKSPHFQAFVSAIEGKTESLTVEIIKKIY